jgi:hypothetical protein
VRSLSPFLSLGWVAQERCFGLGYRLEVSVTPIFAACGSENVTMSQC